jgi:nocturnin
MEEVDHFHDFLSPQLEQNGFKGLFVEKIDSPCLEFSSNNGPDGCALFYRSSKLTLLKKEELVLNREDGTKSHQVAMMVQLQLSPGISDSESASKDDVNIPSKENLEKSRPEEPVAASVSADQSTQTVCVAVTHLKAKREGSKLRLAQGKHLLTEIQSFAENHPIVVCGDFNAPPDEPVCELFKGSDSPLKLSSSYVTPHYGNKEPPLTSWKFRAAGESKYTIDYIWFNSDMLKVDSIWTVPTEEEIGKDGLPCAKYPSDHVALCTCFRLETEPIESV